MYAAGCGVNVFHIRKELLARSIPLDVTPMLRCMASKHHPSEEKRRWPCLRGRLGKTRFQRLPQPAKTTPGRNPIDPKTLNALYTLRIGTRKRRGVGLLL